MGAGSDLLSRRASKRALDASPIIGVPQPAPVLELASYAGRDAPPATLTRWRGGQWGTLSWSDLLGIMQSAEITGATEDWARLTRRMYQDAHLLALRGTRLDPISGADFDVAPGGASAIDAQAARDVDLMLRSIPDLPTLLDAILDAVFVGYSVQEIIWGVRGSWVWPEAIDVLEPHRFRFDRLIHPYLWDDGRLGGDIDANMQIGLMGKPLRENKFIVHMPRVIPDYAISSGILRSCVRPWWVKWQCVSYNLSGAEVSGNPRAIGFVPVDTPQPLRQNLFDDLQNLSATGTMVVDERVRVEIQNPSAQGASSVWSSLQQWCDDSMTKAVLGSTLNTEVGATGGNRALGESQAATTIDPRIKKDSASLWATLTRDLIRPFLEFNSWRYGGRMPALPVVSTRFAEELSPKPSAELITVGGVTIDELRARDGLPEWGPERGGNRVARTAADAASMMPTAAATPAAGGAEAVADTALNGAQIASLAELLAAVSGKTLAPEAAIITIRNAFPSISDADAASMVQAQASIVLPSELLPQPAAAAPAATTPLAAEYTTAPSVGEVWHDSQDGHRLEVKAVGGGHVYFADLDDANPQRQWRWTEQHFAERCIPPASSPSASPETAAAGIAGQLAMEPAQTTYASGGAPAASPFPWEMADRIASEMLEDTPTSTP